MDEPSAVAWPTDTRTALKHRASILLVDDQRENLIALVAILESLGQRLVCASSGRDALRQLLAEDFAVILLDVQMPDIDGFETATLIRQRERSRRTPIIFLTAGYGDEGHVFRGYAVGAVDYVVKPVDPEILRSKVAIFVELAANAAALREANERLQANNAELEARAQTARRANEELQSTQSQLVQAAKLAALGKMVAGIAHEINNPLAFVINNVAVLQRDVKLLRRAIELYQAALDGGDDGAPARAELEEYARDIDLARTTRGVEELLGRSREGLARIGRIVKDLREFSRLDRNSREPSNLNTGIEATGHILAGVANAKGVAVEMELGPIPLVLCDLAKINQVMLNLIANAIDASPRGGRVRVSSRAVDDGVELSVADEGAGIDPAIRDRIFDPFFTTKGPGEGTGLGLSISYTIIREHGGTIEVESAPGKGSRFLVRLPLTSVSATGPQARGAAGPSTFQKGA